MELMLQSPSGAWHTGRAHVASFPGTLWNLCLPSHGWDLFALLISLDMPKSQQGLPWQPARTGSWAPAPRMLLGMAELGMFQILFAFLPITASACSVLLKMCIPGPFLFLNWINGLIDIKWYPQWHNETWFKSGKKKVSGADHQSPLAQVLSFNTISSL